MKGILIPAMYLLERLRYPLKFCLIFLVALVPLVVLSFTLVDHIDERIEAIEHERQGLTYIQAVRQPIEHLQQHRGMTSAYLNGAKNFRDRIMNKRIDVDGAMEALLATDRELGAALGTDGKLSTLLAQWESIKRSSMNKQVGEAIQDHNDLVTGLIDLVSQVADASEITLDAELDTYYLGDAVVNNLINLTENMGRARALGSGAAAWGTVDEEAYVGLSVLASSIDSYAKRSDAGLQAAIRANKSLGEKLTAPVAANSESIARMQALLKKLLSNPTQIDVDEKTVFDTATVAITGSYQLYDAIADELDRLFAERIAAETMSKHTTMGVVILVLLGVIYLFAGLYYSVVAVLTGSARRPARWLPVI